MLDRFCKVFSQVGQASITGLQEYVKEVKSRTFPDLQQHTYMMDPEELKKFNEWKEWN